MTIFNSSLAPPESLRRIVGTTAVDLLATGNLLPIGKIHLCNVTAGAISFDLEVSDGATSYFIEKGRALAANASLEIRDEVLQSGETLRARASVAAGLHVHIVKAIMTR